MADAPDRWSPKRPFEASLMPPSRSLSLLAAALLAVSALWLSLPVAATHGATFETTIPASASNHAYQNLTVKRVAGGGNLTNASVQTWFKIESSANLFLEKSNVGTSLSYRYVNATRYSNSTVGGTTFVNSSTQVQFSKMTFKGEVRLLGSRSVHFDQSTFEKCLSVQDSNYTFTGTQPPPCGTTHPDPTTPPPTSTSPTSVKDCYADGRFVPCPTTSTPTPTKPTTIPYDSYVYELVGQRLFHNVYVRGADRVLIRESTIVGDVYIGSSASVLLEQVDVTGTLHLDHANGVDAVGLHVGGDMGLSSVSNFKILGGPQGQIGTIGGSLGCFRCSDGAFSDLRVGGAVEIVESVRVERFNVVAQSDVDYTPEAAPTPGPGALMLNVTDEGMAFTHQTELTKTDVGVVLDFSPVLARARLELSPAAAPDEPHVALESRFEKIVEFEDRNGDGGYDLSDLVLREYLVEDLKASVAQERLGQGEEGWRGRIDYALPDGGTFSLIFTAKDENPDDTKIDVGFLGYPYAHERSQLALQVRLASASDWDLSQNESEDRLLFHGRGVDGYFSWLHTVHADGADAAVVARVLEEHRSAADEREVVLYLAYPHADDILHDPSIGLLESFGVSVPELGNLLVYGTTLVAVLAVLWALGQSSRRRNT